MSELEPKFYKEYVSQFLYDAGAIDEIHLQSMRVSLTAFYRRIKYVNMEADLDRCILNVTVKFKWWYTLLPKKSFLRKIKGLLDRNLPKQHRMVHVDGAQPALDQVPFEVNIGRLGRNDSVRWLR